MTIDRFRDLYVMTLDIYENHCQTNILLGQAITEVEITFGRTTASMIIKTMVRGEAIDVNLRKLVFKNCPKCNPCIQQI